MPLRIFDDGQRQEHRSRGSTIYYTHAGWGEVRQIRQECRDPETLRPEEGAVEEAILRRHVVGWDNVLDAEDKPVPFTHEALLFLPPLEVDILLGKIYSAVREEEEEQGESESSSST
jgi:hypothetical protein